MAPPASVREAATTALTALHREINAACATLVGVLWCYVVPLSFKPATGCPGPDCNQYCYALLLWWVAATPLLPAISIAVQRCCGSRLARFRSTNRPVRARAAVELRTLMVSSFSGSKLVNVGASNIVLGRRSGGLIRSLNRSSCTSLATSSYVDLFCKIRALILEIHRR